MNKSFQYLLVEPISKTQYPPLGLMKISTMLKTSNKRNEVFTTIGNNIPNGLSKPQEIYITSLFTWDLDSVVKTIHFYTDRFPKAIIHLGGIAATLLPEYIQKHTGITPHIGLLEEAEKHQPDYSVTFQRKIDASMTVTSRGCPNKCFFCNVKTIEPCFDVRKNWSNDIDLTLPRIVLWDNNFLASPNLSEDCKKLREFGKSVDFNQGLDCRLYTPSVAKMLSKIRLNPVRFAFDDINREKYLLRAIALAKKYSTSDIRVYVLYNFEDSPEDFYYRINLLNKEGVLSFPMEYRRATHSQIRFPGPLWNTALLRALRLSFMFYYHKGMITKSQKSFKSIYGSNSKEFISKLYEIYEYDKKRKA
jgi:hypothetical protein